MNMDDGASPSSQVVCHNDELSEVEDDCYVLLIFFNQKMILMMENLENRKLNIMRMTIMHMITYWMDIKVTMRIMGQCQIPKLSILLAKYLMHWVVKCL